MTVQTTTEDRALAILTEELDALADQAMAEWESTGGSNCRRAKWRDNALASVRPARRRSGIADDDQHAIYDLLHYEDVHRDGSGDAGRRRPPRLDQAGA